MFFVFPIKSFELNLHFAVVWEAKADKYNGFMYEQLFLDERHLLLNGKYNHRRIIFKFQMKE